MARSSVETVLLLGRNTLVQDVGSRLAAGERERRVVPVLAGAAAGPGQRAVDPASSTAARALAEMLAELRPSQLVLLALSESALTPAKPWLHDAAVADAVSGAMRRCAELAVRPPDLIALSSTAVYGVARRSPLLFDETSVGSRQPVASAYERWADGLRQAEAELLSLREELRVGVSVLRSASVIGGDMDSPLGAWLRAALPLRVLGFDPPVQVLGYDDLVTAIVLAVETRSREVLNIVGRGSISLSRLLALAATTSLALPGPFADRLTSDAMDGPHLRWRALADGRRARQVLGFRPVQTVEEALRARR